MRFRKFRLATECFPKDKPFTAISPIRHHYFGKCISFIRHRSPDRTSGTNDHPRITTTVAKSANLALAHSDQLPISSSARKERRMQFFGGSDINPSLPASLQTSGNDANMMYIFNRNGVCLLYREWNRLFCSLDPNQDQKLMFGLLFSLKSLTSKMDPTSVQKVNLGVPLLPGEGCSFHSFRTNTYKLSFMETPSGIKLILVTDPRIGDMRESLKYIFNLYVEYVVKNPLYTPGSPIRSEQFNIMLDQYVRGLG